MLGIQRMNIDKINNLALNAGANNASEAKNRSNLDPKASKADIYTLRNQYSSIIQQAVNSKDVDLDAVEQAKLALDSGQLDSPDAARSAAEAIINLGI